MRTYEIRNKRTHVILGEVAVDEPEEAFTAWLRESGMTLEDAYQALGGSMEAVRETLDIVEVETQGEQIFDHMATRALRKAMLPRRRLYCEGIVR